VNVAVIVTVAIALGIVLFAALSSSSISRYSGQHEASHDRT
jgi:hypothetical protein